MTHIRRRPALALAATFTAFALAACSQGAGAPDGDASDADTEAPVTITVGNMPTTENPELRADFERKLDAFTEAHPNITIEPEETEWAADTWNALIAGGTMPTVISAPFTEIQSMIARGQVADVTDYLADSEVFSRLNPSVLAVAQAEDRTYAIPTSAWTMGLLYNRDLFEQAGLDPDAPPQTWDEVRTAAQAIDEQTEAQGFLTMTLDNTGGWVLTTMSYAFGSTLENEDATEATIVNDATTEVLDYYQQLRWEDETMGSNFLVNYDDAVQLFASGQVGMFVQGADNYTNMVVKNGMDPEHFGVAPLPQQPAGLGTLSGGNLAVFSPTATPEQLAAAVAWVEFRDFLKYTDEEVAVSEAEAAAADGVAVGEPALPVVDRDVYDQWLGWVEPYINVPRENYDLYLSTVEEVTLVPEPPAKAQELYNTLDAVVQGVLTRQDADIEQLLQTAQDSFQSALELG
ncbi:ABC transporter substrate-binding protein [Pseudactinotalea suaedae]|uniref:ABC transporter substrate-binding protein n=1 Tax=Pseudactinotalea suaedae TaxID=1524924 RepID=UPI0012E25ECC|nr:extracellular solute-binding protein [Pseudactinotalea suaedae]